MATMIVPPGGFAGFSQMTPASRVALNGGPTRKAGVRRTRKSASRSGARRKVRATGTRKKKGRKMKFGSPAWQKKYKVGKYRK